MAAISTAQQANQAQRWPCRNAKITTARKSSPKDPDVAVSTARPIILPG